MSTEQVNAIASCISAGVSMLALVGLLFYVKYTKKMMEAADATLRASLEPIVVPDIDEIDLFKPSDLTLSLTNEGKGPALQLSYVQLDDEKSIQEFGNFKEFIGDMSRTSLGILRAEHPRDAKLHFTIRRPKSGIATLVVVVYRDSLNTWHQCQIKYQQIDQLSWKTNVAYSRKASSFTVSRYKYPRKLFKASH